MKSPLFIAFILFSGILTALQLTLKLAIEVIIIAGKIANYPPKFLSGAAVWLYTCSLIQSWWTTVL